MAWTPEDEAAMQLKAAKDRREFLDAFWADLGWKTHSLYHALFPVTGRHSSDTYADGYYKIGREIEDRCAAADVKPVKGGA
jgi:hypothetical protein